MIAPQKFSKSLAKNKFKVGLSMSELSLVCVVVPVCTIFEVDEFISLMASVFIFVVMIIKNKMFEPRYFKNSLERRPHMKWERVKVRIND